MDKQLLCFSLVLLFPVSVSVSWKMTVSPKVTASRGENVVLNCSISPTGSEYSETIAVKWFARSEETPFFECSIRNESLEGTHDCLGSVLQYSLYGDPRRGELSLLITNVQLTNGGRFFCKVELKNWKDSQKIDLTVKGTPQILSLSVVNGTCGQHSSATRWLKCETEGNTLPKVVWLSPSNVLLENQGENFFTGSWRRTACFPYLKENEDQEITCRAENSEGFTERSFPESNNLKMIVITVSVVILVLISAVILFLIFIFLRKRQHQPVYDSPVDGAELQPVYSDITYDPSAQVNSMQATHHSRASDVMYSPVKAQQ